MRTRYDPEGYDKDRSLAEKLIFSFPEYMVYETRIGGWVANQIIKILGIMNRLAIDRIPKRREDLENKIMKSLTVGSMKILNWINYFREKREPNTELPEDDTQ